jgi:homoserine O-succinyltransferase
MSHDPLRVGVLNLSANPEADARDLALQLGWPDMQVRTEWIRLGSRPSGSSEPISLRRLYRTFERVIGEAPLDALVVAGTPEGEPLAAELTGWGELSEILEYARAFVPSTLGLSFGGLVLGEVLGFSRVRLEQRLFGVFPLLNVAPFHPVLASEDRVFSSPQARYTGLDDAELERAARVGTVRLLARSAKAGYSIFESADRRYIAHLGRPDLEPARLVHDTDRAIDAVACPGITDARRVRRSAFFARWLDTVYVRTRESRSDVARVEAPRRAACR